MCSSDLFIIMSLMSPPFIGAYSWIMLFGRAGFVTRLFANIGIHLPSIYGKLGIILVFTFKLFPYVVSVRHPLFVPQEDREVTVYARIESILPVMLEPVI